MDGLDTRLKTAG